MSAVERLEAADRIRPRPSGDPVADAGCGRSRAGRRCAAGADPAGARLRPLLALAPYVARYRGRAVLALIALTVAALTTLLVPVAVRRMIDFGFTPEASR